MVFSTHGLPNLMKIFKIIFSSFETDSGPKKKGDWIDAVKNVLRIGADSSQNNDSDSEPIGQSR